MNDCCSRTPSKVGDQTRAFGVLGVGFCGGKWCCFRVVLLLERLPRLDPLRRVTVDELNASARLMVPDCVENSFLRCN